MNETYIPQFATTELSKKSVSVGANCSAVNLEIDNETILAEIKNNYMKLLAKNNDDLQRFAKEYDKANYQCNYNSSQYTGVSEAVSGLKGDVSLIGGQVIAKRTELSTCRITEGDSSPNCKPIAEELIDLVKVLNEKSSILSQKQIEQSKFLAEKTETCAKKSALDSEIRGLNSVVIDLTSDIAKINEQVVSTISGFGNTFGGEAAAVFSSRSVNQENELRAANPHLLVRPVYIKSAKFQFSPPIYGGWQRFAPGVARRSQLIEIKQLSDLQSPYVYF